MAKATEIPFSKFKLLVGDGATPEAFDIICALTSKGVQYTTQTKTNVVLDCDDEDAPGYEESQIDSIKVGISGSGKVARENKQVFLDWFYSGKPKNIKLHDLDAPDGDTEYEQGPAVLTQLSLAGESKGKLTFDFSIEFSEQPTRVEAAE